MLEETMMDYSKYSAQEIRDFYARLVNDAEKLGRRYWTDTGVQLDQERAMWAVLAIRSEANKGNK